MKTWSSYEEVATYLLNEFAEKFGLERVEGKQLALGHRSGTIYEIDGKGFCHDGTGFVIVECRRYTTSKQNQEKVGALAYRIIDTGAKGGIIVSPLGLQEGANLIAGKENIVNVLLNKDSTQQGYFLQFLNKIMVGLHATLNFKASLEIEHRDKDGNLLMRSRSD
jgi:hypothetical protein